MRTEFAFLKHIYTLMMGLHFSFLFHQNYFIKDVSNEVNFLLDTLELKIHNWLWIFTSQLYESLYWGLFNFDQVIIHLRQKLLSQVNCYIFIYLDHW